MSVTRTPLVVGAAVAMTLLLGGCASKWVYVREVSGDLVTTHVDVTSAPPGADVSVNGAPLGKTPLTVPVRYPYRRKIYERRNFWPYPRREEKVRKSFPQNSFTFQAFLVGYSMAQREIRLYGEEKAQVELKLHAVR